MKIPNIFKAFGATVRAARFFWATGRIHVKDTDRKERLAVCSVCPHVIKITDSIWQCGVCTCFLQAKAGLITEKCPKNLWIK